MTPSPFAQEQGTVMDDHHSASGRASGHVLQGPHREFTEAAAPEFVPLRLLLQPGGLCVEVPHREALIGRHSEADLRLALPDISRRHCRIIFQDGHWKVIDLNSLNGVFVNGERMQEATLYDGDCIRLGSLSFVVQASASRSPGHVFERIADLLPVSSDAQRQAS